MNNNSNDLQFRLKSNNLEGKRGKWWKHWDWYGSKFSLVDQPWTNVSDHIKWNWIVDSLRLHQTWILNRTNLQEGEDEDVEQTRSSRVFFSFWVTKCEIHLVTSRWETRANPNWNQGEWRKTNDATFHYFFTLNVNKNEIEEFFFKFFFFFSFSIGQIRISYRWM